MDNIVNEPQGPFIAKANRLIEARYKFNLWEMRVFTTMISLIKPSDIEFSYCKLHIKDLMKFYNSSSKEDYETIRRVPISLSKKQVELLYIGKEGKRRWANVTLFPTVTRPADDDPDSRNAYIELKFNEELKPLLLALKDKYRIYDIQNIVPLRSVYAIRLFELLKQYENTKQKSRQFELSYLKEMLGLIETDDDYADRVKRLRGEAKEAVIREGKLQKYPLYADFKKRVLRKAQKDLRKHCDITFTFDEVKQGRKVVSLMFQIKSQADKSPKTEKEPEAPIVNQKTIDQAFAALYPKVKKWMGEDTFRKLLANQPAVQVKKAIELTLQKIEKGETIANVAGYIISLSRQSILFNPLEKKKEKAIEKKNKKKEIIQKKEELQAAQKRLYKELREAEDQVIAAIFAENPLAEQSIYESIKTTRFYDTKKSIAENQANPLFIAAYRNTIRKKYPLWFEASDKKYHPAIKKVKTMLNRL